MEITLQKIMAEISKYHYMYGDLMVANSKSNQEFKRAYINSEAQYDKIRDMIKMHQQQAVNSAYSYKVEGEKQC